MPTRVMPCSPSQSASTSKSAVIVVNLRLVICQPPSASGVRKRRRRLKIAQDSGNRYDATNLATMLCRIEAVTVTLLPLSITSPWPSAVTSTPATPR